MNLDRHIKQIEYIFGNKYIGEINGALTFENKPSELSKKTIRLSISFSDIGFEYKDMYVSWTYKNEKDTKWTHIKDMPLSHYYEIGRLWINEAKRNERKKNGKEN